MRLTKYTDYSLRVLIYVALHGERLCTIREIAQSYKISKNHLMKVVHELNISGYLETVRGKNGGIRLGKPADRINIGELIRSTEQDMALVECFSADNRCVITPACRLKHVLAEALDAFCNVLNQYNLEDLLPGRKRAPLISLLQIEPPKPKAKAG